jgi:hypothetical protein
VIHSSAAPIPNTTPTSSRTAFSPRSPSGALSAMTAAIGAKKGWWWSMTWTAITQATVAAAVP